jgi:hypothetical protein
VIGVLIHPSVSAPVDRDGLVHSGRQEAVVVVLVDDVLELLESEDALELVDFVLVSDALVEPRLSVR